MKSMSGPGRQGLFASLLVTSTVTWAQTYSPPTGELYQIWQDQQTYFDVLRGQMTEEEFYHEGGEYAEFQKWFRHWEIRLAPHGDFDVYGQLMKSYCDAKFHDGSSFKSNNDPWLELGPKRRRNNMGGIGPIRKITISKDDPDHMLCTGTPGGLFYTINGGDEWHNAGTDLGWPQTGGQHAEYYPGEPNAWFALCAYGYGKISYVGGVYRTTDAGTSWEWVADQSNLAGAQIKLTKLLFDEKLINGDHKLFLGTSAGLYACENPIAANPSWYPITIFPPASIDVAYPGAIVYDVHVEDIEYLPISGTSTLCASMKFSGVATGGPFSAWRFMLSTDNGSYWTEIANQPAIDASISAATVETSAAAPNSFYCLALKTSSWVKAYDVVNTSWSDQAVVLPKNWTVS